MKKAALIIITVLLFGTVNISASESKLIYYVSASAQPGGNGSENAPFKTIEEARDAIRTYKETEGLPIDGAEVVADEGTYTLTETIKFTKEDSGTRRSPITYKTKNGKKVTFSGGVKIDSARFLNIDDENIKARLKYPENVLCADISYLGDTDILPYDNMTWDNLKENAPQEIFAGGKPLNIARWPNGEYAEVGEITDKGVYYSDKADKDKCRGFTIKTEADISRWAEESDPRLYGMWYWDWAESRNKIAAIDAENSTVTSDYAHSYGIQAGQRYYAYNILAELDEPGEYYIDRENKKLYMWATDVNDVVMSVCTDSLVSFASTEYLNFEGFDFAYSRGTKAFDGRNMKNCSIKNCRFYCLSGGAAYIGGYQNTISGCEVFDTNGGISLSGGNRTNLMPGLNKGYNNKIYRFDRIKKVYNPAISIGGVGNIASHNEIFDSVHLAIMFMYNDHIIEYNNIHDVMKETSDAGAIYSYISTDAYASRGTKIRYNYFHNTGKYAENGIDIYKPGCHRNAVYLDGLCGTEIYGNIFQRVEQGAIINSGRNNSIYDNTFLDVPSPVMATDLNAGSTGAKLFDITLTEYYSKYPNLMDLKDDPEYGTPKYNVVKDNITTGNKIFTADRRKVEESKFYSENDFDDNMLMQVFEDDFNGILLNAESEVFTKKPAFDYPDATVMGITQSIEETSDFGDVIKVIASSEKSLSERAAYAADGNYATVWVSNGDGYIELDLGKRYNVNGLHYEPAPNETNAAFYKYIAEISNDRLHYTEVSSGTNSGKSAIDISFNQSFSARYIRLRSCGMAENQEFISAAEIYPILSNDTEPKITDVKIEGTAAVGETLEGFYRYYGTGEESSRYAWYVDGRKVQSGKCTDMCRPVFTAAEADGGKTLTLKIFNGNNVYTSEGIKIFAEPADTSAEDEAVESENYDGFEISNSALLCEANYFTGKNEAILTKNINGMQKVYRIAAEPKIKSPVISYLDDEDNSVLFPAAEKTDEEAQNGIYSYIWAPGEGNQTVYGPYYKIPKTYDSAKFTESTPYIVSMYLKEPSNAQHTELTAQLLYIGGGNPYKSAATKLSTDKWSQWLAVSTLNQKNINPVFYGTHPAKVYIDNIRVEQLAAAQIKAYGANEIAVPESGTKTEDYTAEVYNQFGTSLGMDGIGASKAQQVKWSIAGNGLAGVSISEQGVLSIDENAKSGIVTLRATAAESDFIGSGLTYGDIRVKVIGKVSEPKAENVKLEIKNGIAVLDYDFTDDMRDNSKISWYYSEDGENFHEIPNEHESEMNISEYGQMKIRCKITMENGEEVYSDIEEVPVEFSVRASGEKTPAVNAFDNDVNTVWQANSGGTKGHWIELDFGRKTLIGGMSYQPVQTSRGSMDYEGAFFDYVLEVSNDGEHYTILADRDEGCTENKPMTALETDTVYARYLRMRCPEWADISYYSTGAAELYPILKEKDDEALPGAIGLEIHGTAMSGETVSGKYLYNSLAAVDEGVSSYAWYTAGTKDGRLHRVGGGYTANGTEYKIREEDSDKYLIFGVTTVDENGKAGREVYSEPVKILSEEEKTAVENVMTSLDYQMELLNAENIMLTDNEPVQRLELPVIEGAVIRYTTDNEAYLTGSGKIIKLANWNSTAVKDGNAVPKYKDGIVKSVYTAHINYGGIEFTRDFKVNVSRAAGKSYKANADNGETLSTQYTAGVEVTNEQSKSGESSYLNTLRYGSPTSNASYTFHVKASDQKISSDSDSLTADSVWIARAYVKAPEGEAKTGIPINAYHVNDASTRGYVLTDNAVSDTEWSEWQMICNKGTLWGGYAREFGFLIYSRIPSKLYVDDIEMELLRVGSVEINGNDTVTPGSQTEYSAEVLNQFGTTLGMKETEITPEQTVKFGIKGYADGITIDETTGVLSISENVKPCSFIITAVINTPSGFVGKNGNVNDISGAYAAEKKVCVVPESISVSGVAAEKGILNADEDVIWQISDSASSGFEKIGEGRSITLDNAGGKYVKAVLGNRESPAVYIAEEVEVTDLTLYNGDNRSDVLKAKKGSIRAEVSVRNNGEKTDVMLICAEYDGSGKLIGISKSDSIDLNKEETERLNVQLLGVNGNADNTVRIFAVESSMKPHTEAFVIKE